MPMITMEYDDAAVNDQEINDLSEAIQKIVSAVTGIEDVFVYANTAKVKVKVAPIEIFIWMSAYKIEDAKTLIEKFKNGLSEWKVKNDFQVPINLTLIPMPWQVAIGI